jgi:hypothetical protein
MSHIGDRNGRDGSFYTTCGTGADVEICMEPGSFRISHSVARRADAKCLCPSAHVDQRSSPYQRTARGARCAAREASTCADHRAPRA